VHVVRREWPAVEDRRLGRVNRLTCAETLESYRGFGKETNR
jgi:hypothetical protein